MKKLLIGAACALVAAAGVVVGPAAPAGAWPMCGTFSLFSEDQCDAIEYCLNHDDPACTPSEQSSTKE